MQNNVPSYDEIKQDFTVRKQLVDQEAHRERSEKRAKREGAQKRHADRAVRGADAAEEEGERQEDPTAAWAALEVHDYGPYFVQDYTQFFMSAEPLLFFAELIEYLTAQGIEYHISGDKLAVKFEAQLPVVPAAKP